MQRVSRDEVGNALEQFVDAREEIFDSWAEGGYEHDMERMSPELKLRSIGRTAQKIHRFLVDHPDSAAAEIRENLPRVQDAVFTRTVEELLRLGLVYRTSSTEDRYSAA
ncbi:MAG: helix-turn-helix domain-containing protein [Nitrososphaerales archaeon]